MSDYAPRVGDLVEAEHLAGISGNITRLRGIIAHVGTSDGVTVTSVYGPGESTMNNSMPVHLVALAESEIARAAVAGLIDNPGTSERVRTRLREIQELVTLRRVRAVELSSDGTITTTEARARAHDEISAILRGLS